MLNTLVGRWRVVGSFSVAWVAGRFEGVYAV